MKDLKSFNGQRLKTARTIKGLSVAEFAEKIGVQRQTVSMYENNKISEPDYFRVQKMSQVLDFPIDFFLDAQDDKVETSNAVYFRSLLTTNKKYRYEQQVKINFVSIIYAYISEYISFPALNLPDRSEISSIEEAAEKLRDCWGLGRGPIDNLIHYVEQQGIIVTSFSTTTSDIDAFSQRLSIDGDERYVIAVSNNKDTASRLHFDIAHELGHILLHDWEDDIELLSPSDFREHEQQANEFASAFLLPKDTFAKDVGKYAGVFNYYIELKKKWKVSIAAMIRRSMTLGLINYEKYQSMMRYMQKLGIRKHEPLDDTLITAKPALLKTAVEMLLNGNVLTPREFMQELSMDYNLTLYPEQVEDLLGLISGTLKEKSIPLVFNLKLKDNNTDESDDKNSNTGA